MSESSYKMWDKVGREHESHEDFYKMRVDDYNESSSTWNDAFNKNEKGRKMKAETDLYMRMGKTLRKKMKGLMLKRKGRELKANYLLV